MRSLVVKTCATCERTYEVKSCLILVSKYCSRPCANAGTAASVRSRRIVKTCEQCGSEFEVQPCLMRARFCTKRCSGLARRTSGALENKYCNSCNEMKPVSDYPSFIRKDNRGHYTSPTCRSCTKIRTQILNNSSALNYGDEIPCKDCKEIKPIGEFYRRGRYRRRSCKVCEKKQAVEYQAKPEYQTRIKDKKRVWAKKWETNNPEKVREKRERRRAREIGAMVDGKIDRAALIERDNYTCYLCWKVLSPLTLTPHSDRLTVDHVVPLSRGGTHALDNLKVACLSCNDKKGAKLLHELDWYTPRSDTRHTP